MLFTGASQEAVSMLHVWGRESAMIYKTRDHVLFLIKRACRFLSSPNLTGARKMLHWSGKSDVPFAADSL